MVEPLRVGIVGAGGAGRAHAAAFGRLPGVAVVAVWGRTRARAEELAAGLADTAPRGVPPVRVCGTWEEVVDRADVDVVSVATPPPLQRAPALAALERGRHVLVEKECGRDVADALAIAAAAGRAGTVGAVSLNWRYAPSTLTAHRAVATGAIGDLLELQGEWRYRLTDAQMEAGTRAKPWLLQPALGGGGLRGGGSHEFDRARFLTGWDFDRLAARLGRAPIPGHPGLETDRRVAVLADMTGRPPAPAAGIATFFALFTPGEPARRMVLCGRAGTLVCTTETAAESVTLQQADDATAVTLPVAPEDALEPGQRLLPHTWNRLIADLVAAIRAGDIAHTTVPRLPTFADGVQLHEVFAAAERADAERRWVRLDEVRTSGD